MMGWYYGTGMPVWMWLVGLVTMLLFWGGLAALVVWAVRAFARPRADGQSAEEILKRRLAAGQISQEEYEKIRGVLRG